MSQGALTVPDGDGASVLAAIAAMSGRLATKASGTSRPSDIATGEHWYETDNPGTGVWSLWEYDGTSDILKGTLNTTTHVWTPIAPTQTHGDNSTKVATTAYVDRAIGQVVSSTDAAVATGTTTIPFDDTIPQNTEGNQYLSVAITPRNASSKLEIEVTAMLSSDIAGVFNMIGALFVDSTADALKAKVVTGGGQNHVVELKLSTTITAGSTSARTYKFRAGASAAGTTTFNGQSGGRLFGTAVKSEIKVTEHLP